MEHFFYQTSLIIKKMNYLCSELCRAVYKLFLELQSVKFKNFYNIRL